MGPKAFYLWLVDFQHQHDVIGDFAKDAVQDKTFPVDVTDPDVLLAYLESCGATDAVKRAAMIAWGMWLMYKELQS